MKGNSLSWGGGDFGVCFGLAWCVWLGEPVSVAREGWHRIGQTKAFPHVTPIRKVGLNDLAGRMAQKGAHPRVGSIRKVAPSGLDGALWPGRGRSRHFESPLGRLGLPGRHFGSWAPAFSGFGSSQCEF